MFPYHIDRLSVSRARLCDDFSACLRLLWYNWISLTGDLLGEAHPPAKEAISLPDPEANTSRVTILSNIPLRQMG